MDKYHKIQTVFKRDPATKYKTLLLNDYSTPEFKYLEKNKWIFTEKVDGTNIRVVYDKDEISFKGKTDKAQIPHPLLKRLNERFRPQLDLFRQTFADGVCFYGEGYGSKIQRGGGNYREDQDFVLFDVKCGRWWLQREAVEDVAKQFGVDVVPIIGQGTLLEMVIKIQRGFNSVWGGFMAEGIVARPYVELVARNGERVITKIKHKDFNLLQKEVE